MARLNQGPSFVVQIAILLIFPEAKMIVRDVECTREVTGVSPYKFSRFFSDLLDVWFNLESELPWIYKNFFIFFYTKLSVKKKNSWAYWRSFEKNDKELKVS